jgi:hypothetical protein
MYKFDSRQVRYAVLNISILVMLFKFHVNGKVIELKPISVIVWYEV